MNLSRRINNVKYYYFNVWNKKKEDLTEDKARIAFNSQMNSIGFRSLARSTFDAWTEGYCTVRGADSTVWINGDIEVVKRKLSPNTKKLIDIYMKKILDNYNKYLKDLHIELRVEDDTGRYYDIDND